MKYPDTTILAFLKFFGDKTPHSGVEQTQLMRVKYPKIRLKEIIGLFRYCIHNGWIKGYGEDFCQNLLGLRMFILTPKGDKLFRSLSVKYGGNRDHFTFFDREKAKEEGSDVGNYVNEIQGANLH